MSYFKWASDMVIDDGPTDQDHLHLVQLVNDLHSATSEGQGKEVVGQILDQLLAYTADHLSREEQLMRAAGFPNLERHQQGHAKFIAQLHALKQRYDAGSLAVAAQLSAVLRDWLSLHIRRSDKELLAYLEQKSQR
ncbi:hemerythrin [Paucibacter sp. KBW04]|nr:hemerythrin [Paucibacter sp. KBW04]